MDLLINNTSIVPKCVSDLKIYQERFLGKDKFFMVSEQREKYLKLSRMKYRGMGFYLPMNAFCLKEGADGYREKMDSRVKFYHRKMDEESYLSICTGNQNKLYYKKVDMKEVMDLPNIIGEQK